MIHFSFCVCVIPFYISVSHAKKKKKKIDDRLFLACSLCFPKSGNLPSDISLLMHTHARGFTCTDDIIELNWEKHTEHTS